MEKINLKKAVGYC